jgi:hypothetical protein
MIGISAQEKASVKFAYIKKHFWIINLGLLNAYLLSITFLSAHEAILLNQFSKKRKEEEQYSDTVKV